MLSFKHKYLILLEVTWDNGLNLADFLSLLGKSFLKKFSIHKGTHIHAGLPDGESTVVCT